MQHSVFSHIKRCAEVPSFSSYEERLHPYIESVVRFIPGAELQKFPVNNLVITIPGKKADKTVVLTAHLDKIDHWGAEAPETLPFSETEEEIEGQLDDTVGLGICLSIMEQAAKSDYPNLIILFSEMEESKGLKEHPERLKNKGRGLAHGQGADELSRYIIEEGIETEAIITIDTTPLFKGKPGIAMYSKWWEMYKQTPTLGELEVTEKVTTDLRKLNPAITEANNTNDYMIYGRIVNRNSLNPVASIALEPAINPYHQIGERVFKQDILGIVELLDGYLKGV
jgi:hypothetical protein